MTLQERIWLPPERRLIAPTPWEQDLPASRRFPSGRPTRRGRRRSPIVQAAPTIAQQAYTSSLFPGNTITFPNPMGAGNLVLAMAINSASGATPATPTDSAGNTYALAVIADDTSDDEGTYIYYCLNGAAHAGTNTVAFTGGQAWVIEVTGASSWTLGPTANKTNPYSGNSSTLSIGPVNITSQPAFLLSGVWTTGTSTQVSAGGSFAYLTSSPNPFGAYATMSGTYAVITSNGNVTSAQTVVASTGWSGVLAAFYATLAAPSNSFFFGSD
jgi:hypothetical protein